MKYYQSFSIELSNFWPGRNKEMTVQGYNRDLFELWLDNKIICRALRSGGEWVQLEGDLSVVAFAELVAEIEKHLEGPIELL